MTKQVDVHHYQYRTLDHAYHFKLREEEQTLTLKVNDISGQNLHKVTTPLAPLSLKSLTLSDATVTQLVPLLIQKGLLPAKYTLEPVAPSQAPTSPVTPAPSDPEAPNSPALDSATLNNLQAIAKRQVTLFKAADLATNQALQAVALNPQTITQLIHSQKEEDQALGELTLLKTQQPDIYTHYYLNFSQKLTAICLASYTIKSGIVDNTDTNISGYLSQGTDYAGQILEKASTALEAVGEVAPIIGPGLKIIGALLKLKNIRDNNYAIAHLTRYFADVQTSLKNIKTLARLLTREREAELKTLKPQAGFKKAFAALKEWYTAEELTNPLSVQAGEDAETLLTAILTRKLPEETTPEQEAAHILGRPLKAAPPSIAPLSPTPSVISITSVSSPSSPSPDAASRAELEQLRKQLEALETKAHKEALEKEKLQRQVEEASKKAQTAHAYTEAAFGPLLDTGYQLQLQDSQDPTKKVSPGQALLKGMNANIAELKARFDILSQTVAANAETQDSHTQRIDQIEAKQAKKK